MRGNEGLDNEGLDNEGLDVAMMGGSTRSRFRRALGRLAMPLRWLAVAVAVLVANVAMAAAQAPLAPYKDDLFKYPAVLSSSYGGDYLTIQYVKQRDIWQRDEVWEQKVHGEYVSLLGFGNSESHITLDVGDRQVKYIAAGRRTGARLIVIYLHGVGGNRFQGNNDWMFGGNFNRIKNLMVRNGGLYVSTDFSNFEARGAEDVKALMTTLAADNPGAPIFVACGSYGGVLCWQVAEDPATARLMGGMLLLGSVVDDKYLSVIAAEKPSQWLPIYIGHGSDDAVIPWIGQEAFFKKVKQVEPDYPIRFVLFDTGSHGTPIRMTDWRQVLNWMLTVRGG